jgi:hypothetical protein
MQLRLGDGKSGYPSGNEWRGEGVGYSNRHTNSPKALQSGPRCDNLCSLSLLWETP